MYCEVSGMSNSQRNEAYLAWPAAELESATAELAAAALELAGGTVVVMVDDCGALVYQLVHRQKVLKNTYLDCSGAAEDEGATDEMTVVTVVEDGWGCWEVVGAALED